MIYLYIPLAIIVDSILFDFFLKKNQNDESVLESEWWVCISSAGTIWQELPYCRFNRVFIELRTDIAFIVYKHLHIDLKDFFKSTEWDTLIFGRNKKSLLLNVMTNPSRILRSIITTTMISDSRRDMDESPLVISYQSYYRVNVWKLQIVLTWDDYHLIVRISQFSSDDNNLRHLFEDLILTSWLVNCEKLVDAIRWHV